MDEKTYARWWEYHIRAVKGETLTAEEQAEYEVGLTALDQEEKEQFQANDLTALRQNEDLSQTIEAQKQYIRALERRLKELKRN